MFRPSRYSYGDAMPSEGAGAGGAASGESLPTQDLVTAVRTFFFGEEARQQAAVIEAKIENLQQQANNTSGPLRTYYLNQINKLNAQLQAVRAEAAEAEYSAQTSAVTRTAVAVGSMVGVLVLGIGAVYVASLAATQLQQAQIKREELRRLRGR